ncbi:Holliday junction resolvase RuvX, partial [Dysosmobacter welbionis]
MAQVTNGHQGDSGVLGHQIAAAINGQGAGALADRAGLVSVSNHAAACGGRLEVGQLTVGITGQIVGNAIVVIVGSDLVVSNNVLFLITVQNSVLMIDLVVGGDIAAIIGQNIDQSGLLLTGDGGIAVNINIDQSSIAIVTHQ